MENIDTPYLSVQFILREFAKAFGTKKSNKVIDDACKQLEINPYKFEELKRDLIHQPIDDAVNVHFADHVREQIDIVFKQYIELMKVISLDGVSATSAQSLIGKKYLSACVGFICSEMLDGMRTTPSNLAKGEQTAIQFVFQNIEKNSVWQSHLQDAPKEQKDRYRVWQKGKDAELPDLKTIASLGMNSKTQAEMMTWGVIKARLITARFWDYFFLRSGIGELNAITNGDISTQLKKSALDLHYLQQVEGEKYQISTPIALELFDTLRLRKPKTLGDKKKSKRLLGELFDVQSRLDKLDETTYYYYWMNARYHLHCGELAPSIESYKRAFELAIYRSGENLSCIVTEAIIVASRLTKPDKVFINRLRAVSALFDIAILPDEAQPTNKKKPELVEEWEISAYGKYFQSYFTKESFFPGSDYPEFEGKNYGVWMVDETKYTPDLATPNKKLAVGELGGLTKRMPQLVYFAMQGDEKTVQALLEAGASVNIKSESNESPLLMAVQEMQVTLIPLNSMRDVMFKAISSKVHTKDTLSLVTVKKKLTILGAAVETGRLDVVKTVLNLGAEVDQRQELGCETPLFTCLGLIANHKRPNVVSSLIDSQRYNDQSLRSMMAHSAGLLPPDKKHLKDVVAAQESDPLHLNIMQATREYQLNNIHQYTSIDELRLVAKILIDHGANPNAKHDTAMLGYTPFMLAAELDEGELFEYMLNAGGDIQSTCVVADTKRRVSCIDIVRNWKAASVLTVIRRSFAS